MVEQNKNNTISLTKLMNDGKKTQKDNKSITSNNREVIKRVFQYYTT